jgi:hypothetical protein
MVSLQGQMVGVLRASSTSSRILASSSASGAPFPPSSSADWCALLPRSRARDRSASCRAAKGALDVGSAEDLDHFDPDPDPTFLLMYAVQKLNYIYLTGTLLVLVLALYFRAI